MEKYETHLRYNQINEKKVAYEMFIWRKRRPRIASEHRRTMKTSDIKDRRLEFRYAQW